MYGDPASWQPSPEEEADGALCQIIQDHLTALLAAVCAAGGLQSLRLTLTHMTLAVGPWLLGASATLCSLAVDSTYGMQVEAPLQHMTALRDLWLDAGNHTVHFQEGCRLPPTLHKLFLGSEPMNGPLPTQVSPDLRVLGLCGVFDPSFYSSLSRLTRLERLSVDCLMVVPPCLPTLSMLCALQITMPDCVLRMPAWAAEDSLPALAGISRLTQLTSLDIGAGVGICIGAVPGLEALTQLRRFTWRSDLWAAEEWVSTTLPPPPPPGSLPAGLAARLRETAMPAAMLLASLPQLLAARQLRLLGVCAFARPGKAGVAEQQWAALRQLAGALPGPLTLCMPPDALDENRRASLLASNAGLVLDESDDYFPTLHFASAIRD